MARCYDFAIVRLSPEGSRGESLNIGLAVFDQDKLDVRAGARLEKIRALSAAVDPSTVQEIIENLPNLDEKLRDAGLVTTQDRMRTLSRIGPISLSLAGQFVADNTSVYEERLSVIMRAMVTPEIAPKRLQLKRSKILTQLKSAFRSERVMAKKEDDLSAHRIISSYSLDEGLVADLVLKNGKMHVVETVDASGEMDSLRKAISEIGVSALVLERARMRFGEKNTEARLVYSASSALEKIVMPSLDAAVHQGATLTNWESNDDRRKIINTLSSLATPIPDLRRRRRATVFVPH